MFDLLFSAMTARADAFRLLFEPRRTAIGLLDRDAEFLLRERREQERLEAEEQCC